MIHNSMNSPAQPGFFSPPFLEGGRPRRWRVRCVATILGGLLSPAMAESVDEAAWQLLVRLDRHTDAVALSLLGDDERVARGLRPRPGRNLALVDDEVRISRTRGPWSWSVLARSHAKLEASADTLDVLSRIELGLRPASDRQWSASGRVRAFHGGGLELGYSSEVSASSRWTLGLQGLALRRWRDLEGVGDLRFTVFDRSLGLQASSRRLDSDITYPFMSSVAPIGWGLLLQASWEHRSGPWRLRGSVRDVGWLGWNGAPEEIQSIDTNTRALDSNGFLVYEPLVTGRYEQRRKVAGYFGSWEASALRLSGDTDDRPALSLGGGLRGVPGLGLLPWLEVRLESHDLAPSLRWDLHQQRLTASVRWKRLDFAVGADRLDSRGRSQLLAVSGALSF